MICKRYGGEKGSIDYLLRNPTAIVKRGDPAITADLIKGLSFKQRFMSGVISWHPDDTPSAEQEEEIIDAFETHFSREQNINFLWVKHSDKNRVELHFVSPAVELGGMRQFSAYVHSVDKFRFHNLAESFNLQYGWKSGQDVDRQIEATQKNNFKLPEGVRQITEVINAHMRDVFIRGELQDRASVLKEIKTLGLIVTRESKGSISVKSEENDKPIRLKGIYYEREFSFDEIERKLREETQRDRRDRAKEGEDLRRKASISLQKRINGDKNRYKAIKGSELGVGAASQNPKIIGFDTSDIWNGKPFIGNHGTNVPAEKNQLNERNGEIIAGLLARIRAGTEHAEQLAVEALRNGRKVRERSFTTFEVYQERNRNREKLRNASERIRIICNYIDRTSDFIKSAIGKVAELLKSIAENITQMEMALPKKKKVKATQMKF